MEKRETPSSFLPTFVFFFAESHVFFLRVAILICRSSLAVNASLITSEKLETREITSAYNGRVCNKLIFYLFKNNVEKKITGNFVQKEAVFLARRRQFRLVCNKTALATNGGAPSRNLDNRCSPEFGDTEKQWRHIAEFG